MTEFKRFCSNIKISGLVKGAYWMHWIFSFPPLNLEHLAIEAEKSL